MIRAAFGQMYEMGHLMGLGPDVVAPALDYLFRRVEEELEGRPTLLVIDEAWLFLSHPIFARRLQAWLKTLRKKNVYVVFATQEVADAAQSPITATIVSACHTKIYLADEEALTPSITNAYLDFGLTEAEIQILGQAQKKRDYDYRSVKGRRLFQLDLGPVALAFAGMSSPDDQRFLDELVAKSVPASTPSGSSVIAGSTGRSSVSSRPGGAVRPCGRRSGATKEEVERMKRCLVVCRMAGADPRNIAPPGFRF